MGNAIGAAYMFVIGFVVFAVLAMLIKGWYDTTEGKWYHQIAFLAMGLVAICVFGFFTGM